MLKRRKSAQIKKKCRPSGPARIHFRDQEILNEVFEATYVSMWDVDSKAMQLSEELRATAELDRLRRESGTL